MAFLPFGFLRFGAALLILTCYVTAAAGQSADRADPTYSRGEVLRVPAPVGFNPQSLGMGRPATGTSFSAVRVLPRRTSPQDVDVYSATLQLQESQFQLSVTAEALGLARAQWTNGSQRRYALLTVEHVSRVERLRAPALPPDSSAADYLISAVYYGWSLNAMIRGNATSFTRGVAADLQQVVNLGGSIDQVVANNELTQEVKLRGLTPKGREIPVALSPSAVQEQFEIGEPQPIAVEYTFLRDVDAERVTWNAPQLGPGTYRIDEIGVRVANQKAHGNNWDPFGNLPDPLVTLYVNGREVTTVGRHRDSLEATFTPERIVDIYGGTTIQLRVDDDDPGEPQPVGTASLRYDDLLRGQPGEEIALRTQDQVHEAWIVLSPVEGTGTHGRAGAIANESAGSTQIASVYRDPEGIFRIGQPNGWAVEREAQQLQNGVYAVKAMLAPPSAHRAELNGYLSHGVRLSLWMAPPGQETQVDVQRWAPRSIRSMLQQSQGFVLTDSTATRVAGRRAIGYSIVGENPAIPEPEHTEIYFFAAPQYTGQMELTSPASAWSRDEDLLRSVLRSFAVRTGTSPGN